MTATDHARLTVHKSIVTKVEGEYPLVHLTEGAARSVHIEIVTGNGHRVDITIDDDHIEVRTPDSRTVLVPQVPNSTLVFPRQTRTGNPFDEDYPQEPLR